MQAGPNPGRSGSGKSWLHHLDVRLKLVFMLAVSFLSVILDNPASLAAIFILSALLAASARMEAHELGLLGLLVLLVTWSIMFSQAIFYYGEPRTVLLTILDVKTPLWGSLGLELHVYREGFFHGAVQSLRFSFMLILGLVFVRTTDPAAMFRALLGLGVPYLLAFMAMTAYNFLPTIMEEVLTVRRALIMRGGGIWSFNPLKTVQNTLKIIRPVLLNCYRRSNILALSIQTRAFQIERREKPLHHRKLTIKEWVIFGCGGLLVGAVVLAKISYWLYLSDLVYSYKLRPVYEFCRYYL